MTRSLSCGSKARTAPRASVLGIAVLTVCNRRDSQRQRQGSPEPHACRWCKVLASVKRASGDLRSSAREDSVSRHSAVCSEHKSVHGTTEEYGYEKSAFTSSEARVSMLTANGSANGCCFHLSDCMDNSSGIYRNVCEREEGLIRPSARRNRWVCRAKE